jgi:hypothetical protein
VAKIRASPVLFFNRNANELAQNKGKRIGGDCQHLLALWHLLEESSINYNKIKFNCCI